MEPDKKGVRNSCSDWQSYFSFCFAILQFGIFLFSNQDAFVVESFRWKNVEFEKT